MDMTSRRVMRGVWAAALGGGALFGGAGCSSQDNARPLTADAFVSRRVEGRANPEPIDQPGLVIPDGVKPQVYEGGDAPEVSGVSGSVRDVVRGSREPADTPSRGADGRTAAAGGNGPPQATADPSAAPGPGDGAGPTAPDEGAAASGTDPSAAPTGTNADDPSGQYVVFGTVLSKVNNQPIYAHRVLTLLDSPLRAEAKRNDPATFRQIAAALIANQVRALEREELVFAAAQKVLAERERALADVLTARRRNEEITRAGGSLELAKRRLADQGWNFDEWMDQQYRASMYMIYLQKRIHPLVQVTATDIRRFYDANRATLFNRQARAKFRVIKIDPRDRALQLDSPDGAERLARELREEAVTGGAEFEAVARRVNAPSLKDSGGLVGTDGWLPRGTYVAEKVEEAVWNLRPGQVTDVIEDRGAFYVAKLEERQDAAERPFEELAVQEEIQNRLEGQQLQELKEREERRLERDAVIQRRPRMLQTAVDMAMQRYSAWAAAQ
jgi:parvulin-like peptidyl-prolyl isomerase